MHQPVFEDVGDFGADWRNGGFGLYVHWPFCASKCPYCDFNSHVASAIDQRRWLDAYRTEIARLGQQTPGRVLGSIFFGGGTPSLMDPAVVAGVIEAARSAWRFANDIEITLEANPGSVERGRFAGYADAGVGRLSMGIQALNDADLRRLGRLHTAAEARSAFDVARAVFPRISFDLIYARQNQSRQDWTAELRQALAMAADHLSLYQLTVEPGTAFGARAAAGGLKGLPDDDLAADLYLDTQDICAAAGMPAYEVSNHAAAGAESRHNLVYWRQGDWASVGPGAHGRLTVQGRRWAIESPRAPGEWLSMVETTGAGERPRVAIPIEEQATEYLLMAMRLAEGLDVARFERLSGGPMDQATIARLQALGFVEATGGRVRATAQGRPVLNAILRDLA